MRNSPLTHHFSRLVYVLKLRVNNPSKVNRTLPTLEFKNLCSFTRFEISTQIYPDTTALFQSSIFTQQAITHNADVKPQNNNVLAPREQPPHSEKQTFWTKQKKVALEIADSDSPFWSCNSSRHFRVEILHPLTHRLLPAEFSKEKSGQSVASVLKIIIHKYFQTTSSHALLPSLSSHMHVTWQEIQLWYSTQEKSL